MPVVDDGCRTSQLQNESYLGRFLNVVIVCIIHRHSHSLMVVAASI